ncbi:MAG: L-fucose/L-arabinose isomerase family protein [Anaerolineae bacterium]
MNSALNIGLVPLARPTFDTTLAREVLHEVRANLQDIPEVRVYGPDDLVMDLPTAQATAQALAAEPLDLLLFFQASFADSTMALTLANAISAPLLLWAVPEARTGGRLRLNSFCGINLAGHSLRRAGFRYNYVYAAPDDPAARAKALTLARAGRVARLLRHTRIGRFGRNPDGFEPCTYDGDALAALLGVKVEQRELTEVFTGARAVADSDVEPVMAALGRRVAGLETLEQPAVRKTLGSYLTLRRLAGESGYAGLAVRCWPEFFTELGCAACGAMSLLSDEGTPCSCEADVNGTITQLILQWLSGGPAFGTDMVGFDGEQDHTVLWHCGLAPLAMADPEFQPRGTVHSNRKLPLLMEFPLKPGRVTIARLTQAGDGAYRLVAGSGEMLRAPLSFSGTSGVLRFDRPALEVLDTIMRAGLDHHISLTYGDFMPELLALGEILNIPVLRLT